jgi:nucleoside-diphosphate-sugar epimerase
MKALVTGATGFVGSHVAEVLKAQGHDVRLLVRNEKRLYPELREGYDIVTGDITQTPDELARAVEGVDWVLHVAGLIKGRSQAEFNRVNAHGTRSLCEAARRAGGVRRFVLVSSLSATGPGEDSRHLVDEDTQPHPVTFYGRSKLLGELYAREYGADFPLTIARPPTVYGPRDTGTLEFFKFMAKGYSIQFGKEEKSVSLIHGRDLAEGIVLCASHEAAAGETFFLTNLEPCPLSWLMELLRAAVQPSRDRLLAPPLWLARGFARMNDVLQVILRRTLLPNTDKMRDLIPQYWSCSGEKARRVLGYEARTPLREGIRDSAQWYMQQGWIKVR